MKKGETRRIKDIQDLLTGKTVDQLDALLHQTKEGNILSLDAMLIGYGLCVDSSGTIKKANDADGNRKVSSKYDKAEDFGTGDQTITVITGERWYVEQVISYIICDATVIARAHTLEGRDLTSLVAFAYPNWQSNTVTLTASQTGGVTEVGQGEWLNTNGSFTRTSISPIPCIFEGGGTIETATGNIQVMDQVYLGVKYRKVA